MAKKYSIVYDNYHLYKDEVNPLKYAFEALKEGDVLEISYIFDEDGKWHISLQNQFPNLYRYLRVIESQVDDYSHSVLERTDGDFRIATVEYLSEHYADVEITEDIASQLMFKLNAAREQHRKESGR